MSAPLSPIGLPVGSVVYRVGGMSIVVVLRPCHTGCRPVQRYQFVEDGTEYGPPFARLTDAIDYVDTEAKERAHDALRADPLHRPEGDAGDYVDAARGGA